MATISEMVTRVLLDIPDEYDAIEATEALETKITSLVTDSFWSIVRELTWWFKFSGTTVPTAGTESIPNQINQLFYLLCMQQAFAAKGSTERSDLYGSMYKSMITDMKAKYAR